MNIFPLTNQKPNAVSLPQTRVAAISTVNNKKQRPQDSERRLNKSDRRQNSNIDRGSFELRDGLDRRHDPHISTSS
jgi:hypothetical protein